MNQQTSMRGIRYREHRRKFEARKTINKQTYTKTFNTLDEAVTWHKGQEESQNSECHLTCGQLFIPWIESLMNSESYSKLTPVKYTHGIHNYYQKHFGDVKVKDVNDKMLMEFVIFLNEKVHLNPKTIKDHVSALSSFFEFCCLRFYAECNPAKSSNLRQMMSRYFKTTRKTNSRMAEKSRTPHELERLLDAAFEHSYEFGLATVFFFSTGIRLGEMAALMWSDIICNETGEYYCVINKTLNPIDKTASKQAKSGSNGHSPLPPILMKHLDVLKAQKNEESNFVFPFINRNQDGFSRVLGKLSEKIGIRRTTAHLLRHSFISYIGTHGVNLQVAQKAARHSKISMTEVYFNASLLGLDKVSSAMEGFLLNSSSMSSTPVYPVSQLRNWVW